MGKKKSFLTKVLFCLIPIVGGTVELLNMAYSERTMKSEVEEEVAKQLAALNDENEEEAE